MVIFHSYVSLPEGNIPSSSEKKWKIMKYDDGVTGSHWFHIPFILIDLPKIIIHPWKSLDGSGTFGRGERFNASGSETFQAAVLKTRWSFEGWGTRLPHKSWFKTCPQWELPPKYDQK